jgi:triacylglycerol lipase
MSLPVALTATAEVVGSFFGTLGRGLGRAAVHTHGAVDPDARRDLAWMPVVALASIGPRRPAVKPLPDDGFRPVVFVHGLAGYPGNFLPMRSWLRLHGRTRTWAVGLRGSTIPAMAEELQAFVAEVARVNELPQSAQIYIVAHSMGGLVSRLALRDPATARRVHTLVTLGTPHRGTHAARFTGGPVMTALRHDSRLMARLDTDLPWTRRTRLVCFWSPSDPLMQPAETATVPGADNREIAGFSHLDWLMRRQSWMDVDAVLRADRT